MPFQNEQLRDLVIRTIIGEAGAEGPDGWRAVAHVIRNRYQAGGYGNGLVQILRPDQFNANANPMKLDPSDPTYQRVGTLVDNVFDGDSVDPTGGATHYYNPSLVKPKWHDMADRKQIGNHVFGKADIKLGEHGLDPRTQNALEWIQAQAQAEGIPLRVTSTRRSEEENRRVGGDRNSQHLTGGAFDLGFAKLDPAQQERVAKIALRAPGINGIKWEGDHLHVDTRAGYRYVGGDFPAALQADVGAFRQGYPLEPIVAAAPAVPAAPAAAPGGPQSASLAASVGTQPVDPTLATSIAAATPATGPVVKTADIPAATATPAASASLIDLPPAPAGVYDATPASTPVTVAPAGEADLAALALALPEVKPFRPLNIGATPRPRPAPPEPPPPVQGFEGGRDVAAPYRPQNEPQGLDKEGSRPLPLAPGDYPDALTPAKPFSPYDRPESLTPAFQASRTPPATPGGYNNPDSLTPAFSPLPLAPAGYTESPNNPGDALTPLAPPGVTRKPEPVTTGSVGGGPPLPPARPPEFGGPPVGGPALSLAGGPDADWQTMMNIARGGTGAPMPQQPPPAYLSAQAQNPFAAVFQRLFGMGG